MRPFDLRCIDSVARFLDDEDPDVVVHLAAISKPADVEERREDAYRVNVEATRSIAKWCSENDRYMAFTSTDYVFGGGQGPYRECDAASPETEYGKLKLEAEGAVRDAAGLVARLGLVVDDDVGHHSDYVSKSLDNLRNGISVLAVSDEYRTPIATSSLGKVLCRLVGMGYVGTVHVAGSTHSTAYEMLSLRAREEGLDSSLIRSASRMTLRPNGRPADVRLNTQLLKGLLREDRACDASGG